MSLSVRRTGGIDQLDSVMGLLQAWANACLGFATIANGTTNGKLKTTSTVPFKVDSQIYTKSATDDLWTLSAIATLSANQYRAVTLYIDAAGTATIDTGTIVTNTNATAGKLAALAACPALPADKSIFGVFVAGPSTNFANALTSQGTMYHGIPTGYGTLAMVPGSPQGVADFPTLTAP